MVEVRDQRDMVQKRRKKKRRRKRRVKKRMRILRVLMSPKVYNSMVTFEHNHKRKILHEDRWILYLNHHIGAHVKRKCFTFRFIMLA